MEPFKMSDPLPEEDDVVGVPPEDDDAADPPETDEDAGDDDGDPALDEEV